MVNLFTSADNQLNNIITMPSYLQKAALNAKIEATLIKAMNTIHSAKDLTDTKRQLIVLKSKIQAGSTNI